MFLIQALAWRPWKRPRIARSPSSAICGSIAAVARTTSARTLPGREQRPEHLASVPVRLGVRDPSQAVAVRPDPALDDDRAEAVGDLEGDERDHLHLVGPDAIVRTGLGEAHRFADHEQQLERDTGPLADLAEGLVGEPGDSARSRAGRRSRATSRRAGSPRRCDRAAARRARAPGPRRPGVRRRRRSGRRCGVRIPCSASRSTSATSTPARLATARAVRSVMVDGACRSARLRSRRWSRGWTPIGPDR